MGLFDESLPPHEARLGNWTVNLLPSDGGRYTGGLTVTDARVMFRAKFDNSLATGLKICGLAFVGFEAGMTTTANAAITALQDAGDALIVIPRATIAGVAATKKGLSKRVVITTTDGNDWVFDYGMLKVDAIIAALHAAPLAA